jgi:hypothetical protein
LSWAIKDRNDLQAKLGSSSAQVEKLLDANISLQSQLQLQVQSATLAAPVVVYTTSPTHVTIITHYCCNC